MGRCEKLLAKALGNPRGLRFRELCRLAECHDFEFSRQSGSHTIYRHMRSRRLISFQNDKGMAKPYQVRQLLNLIEEMERTDG